MVVMCSICISRRPQNNARKKFEYWNLLCIASILMKGRKISATRRTLFHLCYNGDYCGLWYEKTTSLLCYFRPPQRIHLIWHNFRNQMSCLVSAPPLFVKSSSPQKSTNEDKGSRWFFDNERENNQKWLLLDTYGVVKISIVRIIMLFTNVVYPVSSHFFQMPNAILYFFKGKTFSE